MKLAFCSEFNDEEVVWMHTGQIPIAKTFQVQARPTKAVLGIIFLLEQGRFPVVKINSINDYPIKESYPVHEAYLRCHMSVIPTVVVEGKEVNVNNDDFAREQDERDRDNFVEPPEEL